MKKKAKAVTRRTILNKIYSRQCRLGAEFATVSTDIAELREEVQGVNDCIAKYLNRSGVAKEVLASIRSETSVAKDLKLLTSGFNKLRGELLEFLSNTEKVTTQENGHERDLPNSDSRQETSGSVD
jgi:hypothetical protein